MLISTGHDKKCIFSLEGVKVETHSFKIIGYFSDLPLGLISKSNTFLWKKMRTSESNHLSKSVALW